MNVICPLCANLAGELIFETDLARVVVVRDTPEVPIFLRVIAKQHVREMTDFLPAERREMMDLVFCVEQALRDTIAPDKINLASLGNLVAHVHWHVIARFEDDAHFPAPIWGEKKRTFQKTFPSNWSAQLALRLSSLWAKTQAAA